MECAEKIYYKYDLFNALESEFFFYLKNIISTEIIIKKSEKHLWNCEVFLLKKDFILHLSKCVYVTGNVSDSSNIDSFGRIFFLKLKFIKYFFETLCHH